MSDIILELNKDGRGAFAMEEGNERVAEMEIEISRDTLIVYHTEVADKLKGKGIATLLLKKMVQYARDHNLKVKPLCSFVSAQFKKRPEEFSGV